MGRVLGSPGFSAEHCSMAFISRAAIVAVHWGAAVS